MPNTLRYPLRNLSRDLQEKYPNASLQIDLSTRPAPGGLSEAAFWELTGRLDWEKTGDDVAVIEPVVAALPEGPLRHLYGFKDILSQNSNGSVPLPMPGISARGLTTRCAMIFHRTGSCSPAAVQLPMAGRRMSRPRTIRRPCRRTWNSMPIMNNTVINLWAISIPSVNNCTDLRQPCYLRIAMNAAICLVSPACAASVFRLWRYMLGA